MYILAIESSCDETSSSVIRAETDENGVPKLQILSNRIASQIPLHTVYGGVVPEIASRAHIEAISRITYEALAEEVGMSTRGVKYVVERHKDKIL